MEWKRGSFFKKVTTSFHYVSVFTPFTQDILWVATRFCACLSAPSYDGGRLLGATPRPSVRLLLAEWRYGSTLLLCDSAYVMARGGELLGTWLLLLFDFLENLGWTLYVRCKNSTCPVKWTAADCGSETILMEFPDSNLAKYGYFLSQWLSTR